MKASRILLATVCLSWGLSAQAQFFKGFQVEAGTELMTQLGVRGKAYFPGNFFASLGLGFAPSFYMDSNASVVSGMGIAGSKTSELMADSLANSFVVSVEGGWAMDSGSGLYVQGGYMMFAGGGRETDEETVEGAVDPIFPYSLNPNAVIDAAASFHALTAHVGYAWQLSDILLISAEAGIIKPLSASVDITVDQQFGDAQRMETEASDYLTDRLQKEVFFPTLAVWASYQF